MGYKKLTPEEKKQRAEERKREKWAKRHKTENGIVYKWCTYGEHWVEENEDNFYINESNRIDGYYPYCIECAIADFLEWKKEHPEQYKESLKKHRRTKKYKDRERVLKQEQRESGYTLQWQRENKDKLKKNNEKRKQHKSHEISKEEWKECKDYFKNENGEWCCCYCGLTEKEHKKLYKEQLHKDHAINEGSNTIDNGLPSCKICNSEKHTDDWNIWYTPENPKYDEKRYIRIVEWLNYIKNKLINKSA